MGEYEGGDEGVMRGGMGEYEGGMCVSCDKGRG